MFSAKTTVNPELLIPSPAPFCQQPNDHHFKALCLVPSVPLPEGRAGTSWEPSVSVRNYNHNESCDSHGPHPTPSLSLSPPPKDCPTLCRTFSPILQQNHLALVVKLQSSKSSRFPHVMIKMITIIVMIMMM